MPKWRLVGWMDNAEWVAVYYSLYHGDKTQIQAALDQIAVWQTRMGDCIPVAVEATAHLFQCYLHDGDKHNEVKRQSMATAVAQFVGLLTEKYLKGCGYNIPIHKRGEMIGIPEWLTNLRHEAAHGLLPSYAILSKGVEFALDWLKVFHWDEQHKVLEERENQQVLKTDHTREEIVHLLRKCISTARNIPPIDGNALQHLCVLISAKPEFAEMLCHVLVENHFISFLKSHENSYLYTRNSGNSLKLAPVLDNLFRKILGCVSKHNNLNTFLSHVVEEMMFSSTSVEICFFWTGFVLDIMGTNMEGANTIDWPPLLYQLIKAEAPMQLRSKALSISGIEKSSPVLQLIMDRLSAPLCNGDGNSVSKEFEPNCVYEKRTPPASAIGEDIKEIAVPESWTLYDGDLSNHPFGLMPGQEKTAIWQTLNKSSLPKAGAFDRNCGNVTPSPAGWREQVLSASDLQYISSNIDLF